MSCYFGNCTNEKEEELETNLDKWFYLLKHLHKLERIPAKLQTQILEKVFKIAEYAALPPKEKQKYEESLKAYNDLNNALGTALEEGFQKASDLFEPQLEEALLKQKEPQKREQKALLKQEEERRQKEEAQKREQEALLKQEEERKQKEEALSSLKKMIQKMHVKGFTITEIAEDLGKTEEEIKKLLA